MTRYEGRFFLFLQGALIQYDFLFHGLRYLEWDMVVLLILFDCFDRSYFSLYITCVITKQYLESLLNVGDQMNVFIRPKESIMLSERFMLFSPIELKLFSGLFRPP